MVTATHLATAFWLAISIGPVIGLYAWVANDTRRALRRARNRRTR